MHARLEYYIALYMSFNMQLTRHVIALGTWVLFGHSFFLSKNLYYSGWYMRRFTSENRHEEDTKNNKNWIGCTQYINPSNHSLHIIQ
jgi:hypothetical protein